MRLFLLGCKVMYREICHAVAQSPHEVDVLFLPKGLHDYGREGMFEGLSRALEAVKEDRYDAILLAYGLCNNGIIGLKSRSKPLVIPRAHDCLTLLMGSRQTYLTYFVNHPGTYYLSPGWIERKDDRAEVEQLSLQNNNPVDWSYDRLLEKYGEKNAQYLMEVLSGEQHYCQITYISTVMGPDSHFEAHARAEAERKKWRFEKIDGDLQLIRNLVEGNWKDSDFLIIPPGHLVQTSSDPHLIIQSEKAQVN